MGFTVLIKLPNLLSFNKLSLFWWIAFVTLYFSVGDLSSKDSEYRRVRLRGQFDHSEEIHVLPRSLNEGERSGGGLGRRPKSGAHIITPFEITDSRWVNKTFRTSWPLRSLTSDFSVLLKMTNWLSLTWSIVTNYAWSKYVTKCCLICILNALIQAENLSQQGMGTKG